MRLGATAVASPTRSLISMNSVERPAAAANLAAKARNVGRAAPILRLDEPHHYAIVNGVRLPVYDNNPPQPAQDGVVPPLPALELGRATMAAVSIAPPAGVAAPAGLAAPSASQQRQVWASSVTGAAAALDRAQTNQSTAPPRTVLNVSPPSMNPPAAHAEGGGVQASASASAAAAAHAQPPQQSTGPSASAAAAPGGNDGGAVE